MLETQTDADVTTVRLVALDAARDICYTLATAEDLWFDCYQGRFGPGHEPAPISPSPLTVSRPVVIWMPYEGIEEYVSVDTEVRVDSKFPNPLACFVRYGYAVLGASYSCRASKLKDLDTLLDYMRAHADEHAVDLSNIALVTASAGGYAVRLLACSDGEPLPTELRISAPGDRNFAALLDPGTRRDVAHYIARIGGSYVEDWDPLTMPSELGAWIDPCLHTNEFGAYRLYATPSRGEGAAGSYVISLPPGYPEDIDRRYPVIYYLHGGGGHQREGGFLLTAARKLMQSGALAPTIIVSVHGQPVGWFSNGNQGAPGVVAGPIQDVIIKDLVPHIDGNYRTIGDRSGRGLEAHSAGGFGALSMAFKYPVLFGYVSTLAGALIDFDDEPFPQNIAHTFGPPDDPATRAYFNAVHPRTMARDNAELVKQLGLKVRLLVGDQDAFVYKKHGELITQRMGEFLTELGIENTYSVLPGIGHFVPESIARGDLEYPGEFWVEAFERFR
jgi:enterochelin esterase-like enzyme